MEKTIALEEGACEANVCGSTPTSKSSISQASDDFLSGAKKKKDVKCDHFSIRGYVAEVRWRDRKIGWPFPSLSQDEEVEKQLADVLPPLHTPQFRWWDCQNCVQTRNTSENAAVSSTVLERICVGRKDDVSNSVNGSENGLLIPDLKKEKGAVTMNDPEDVLTSDKSTPVARTIDKSIKDKVIPELEDMQCCIGIVTEGAVNLNTEASRLVECEGINFVTGEYHERPTYENLKNAELVLENKDVDPVISLRRRKYCPSKFSDDEDEDVSYLCSPLIADLSHNLSSGKPQKFRLLSDILREEVSGDFKTKFDQARAPNQPENLDLCGQTDVERGTKRNKLKRKTLLDKENLVQMRCSEGLTKNLHYYQRDKEENDNEAVVVYSESPSSYGSQFTENEKYGMVDENDRQPQRNKSAYLKTCQEVYKEVVTNDKFMDKEREVPHVEWTNTSFQNGAEASIKESVNWGLKNKRGSLKKNRKRPKQKNTYKTLERANSMEPKDLPLACNSKINNLRQTETTTNQIKERAYQLGEEEALDDIPLEIVELLAKNRHERLCQEAKSAEQIKFHMSEEIEKVQGSENVLNALDKNLEKKVRKNCKSKSFNANQVLQSHFNDSGDNQSVKTGCGNETGVQFHRWDEDLLGNKWPVSYSQCSTSHPNYQVSNPVEIQRLNHVLRQKQIEYDLEMYGKITSEQTCACTQKKIGNFLQPATSSGLSTNGYMPATELLQLMDEGMCPRASNTLDKKLEFEKRLPVPLTDHRKEHLSLNCGLPKDLSIQDVPICFNKDYTSTLGTCFPCDPIIYPILGHGNSALNSGIKTVSETVDLAGRVKEKHSHYPVELNFQLKKPGCGSEDLGKNSDTFSMNSLISNLGFSSVASRLNDYSIGNVKVGKDVQITEPMDGNLRLEICSVNRNPADFTIPKPGNRYMRGVREWNREKVVPKRGRPRKRTLKLPDLNENAQD